MTAADETKICVVTGVGEMREGGARARRREQRRIGVVAAGVLRTRKKLVWLVLMWLKEVERWIARVVRSRGHDDPVSVLVLHSVSVLSCKGDDCRTALTSFLGPMPVDWDAGQGL